MSYAAHEAMVAPARRRPALWRLAAGVLLVIAVTLTVGQTVIAAAATLLPAEGLDRFLRDLARADTAPAMLTMLLAMGALGLGALLAARLLHARPARSLFGPHPAALRQGLRVLGAIALLDAILLAVLGLGAEGLSLNMAPATWLALLPLSALAVLVQTGSEELFFRGYLQSQLAARFRSPLLWMGLPSLIFALGHYAATFGENAWLVAGWAGLFGLAAADLTARAGTLGPAMALHFANNAVVLLVVGLDGTMSGLALYVYPFGAADAAEIARALPLDYAVLGVSWLAARVALRA
ncbi:CPBP family intramembrane glutamic endopeptidase [Roseivivax sp. CAU 1761]